MAKITQKSLLKSIDNHILDIKSSLNKNSWIDIIMLILVLTSLIISIVALVFSKTSIDLVRETNLIPSGQTCPNELGIGEEYSREITFSLSNMGELMTYYNLEMITQGIYCVNHPLLLGKSSVQYYKETICNFPDKVFSAIDEGDSDQITFTLIIPDHNSNKVAFNISYDYFDRSKNKLVKNMLYNCNYNLTEDRYVLVDSF